MKFRSVKLVAPKKLEIFESQLDNLKDDDVLIKVISCGVCSTERSIYEGKNIGTLGCSYRNKKYPADLGHEATGEVIEIGKCVKKFSVGDIVSGLTYSSNCFSEFIKEKEIDLIKIPKTNKEDAKYIILEPIMSTVNILHQLDIKVGDKAFIVGDGFMSLLLIAGLSKYPLSELVVVGHHDYKLNLAKDLGATKIINNTNIDNRDINEELFEITKLGFDLSIEYAGNTSSLALAASVCKAKARSQLVLGSSYSNDMPFVISNYLPNRAPIIVPSYPHQSKNKILDLERAAFGVNNIFPIKTLITHEFNFDNVNGCFEIFENKPKNFIKSIFLPI